MLNTIKSKIIFLTISVLFVLSIILAFVTIVNFNNNKDLIIKGGNYYITSLTEQANKKIINLENNSIDLALLGEIYYKTGKNQDIANYMTKKIFKNYKGSLGGGIWFEPYVINNKLRSYIYVFNDENNKMIVDTGSNNDYNNYYTANWFTEIKPQLSQEKNIAWSRPYFDTDGAQVLMTTVGSGIYDNGKFIGISTVDWKMSSIIDTVSTMKPTPNSFVLFADKNNDYVIVSTDKYTQDKDLLGKSLKEIPWYSENLADNQSFIYHNTVYIPYIKTLDNNMLLIINIPKNELYNEIIKHMIITFLLLLLASGLIAWGIYYVLENNINQPIDKLTDFAKEIGNGNLDKKIVMDTPEEFAQLAKTFNKMTSDIQDYMNNLSQVTKEKEKMASELSIARDIQYSVLPSTSYDDVDEFDIFGYMDTAKEVGGDFYDFFFINPNQLMFLIADVSGKGIPAALFMMTTRALIKNIASEEYTPRELIEKVNNQVCANNKHGFFVTMFACIVDTKTGDVAYINCGHNPPLIKRNNKDYEYLKLHSNLVLGVYEDFNYVIDETKLNKNDTLFLYTDGVTEALNDKHELYGENRLLHCLNSAKVYNASGLKTVIDNVRADVKNYVGNAEQSDDITMVAFKFYGDKNMTNNIVMPAKVENFSKLNSWLEKFCNYLEIPKEYFMKIQLVAEEIFVNVASYAYPNGDGEVEVSLNKIVDEGIRDEIVLEFVDSGVEYNPLNKPNPDITLEAEDRPLGGLGIYMVKKYANSINYNYKDGKNILTMKFFQD